MSRIDELERWLARNGWIVWVLLMFGWVTGIAAVAASPWGGPVWLIPQVVVTVYIVVGELRR